MLVTAFLNQNPWREEKTLESLEWEHEVDRYEYYSLPSFYRNFGYLLQVDNRKLDSGFKARVYIEDGVNYPFEKLFDDAESAKNWCIEIAKLAETLSEGLNKSEKSKLFSRWYNSEEVA